MVSSLARSGGAQLLLLLRVETAAAAALAGALVVASGCDGHIGSNNSNGNGGEGGDASSNTATTGQPSGSQSGAGGIGTAGTSSTGAGGAGGEGAGASASSASSTSGAASSTSSGGGDTYEQVTQLCVDTINAHRASIGLPPYQRWKEAEACSGDECMSDSQTQTPHGAFGQCGEFAQNECPNWPGPPEQMIEGCLQMMWDEGPGADFQKHGHYINMSSQNYSKVACGFYVMANGSVWSVQNFK